MNRFALLAVCFLVLFLLGCGPNRPEGPKPPPVAEPQPAAVSALDPRPQPMQPVVDSVDPVKVEPVKSPPSPTPTKQAAVPTSSIKSVPELIVGLEQDEGRQDAAVALASKGNEALPALFKALEHSDWQVRAAAVFALGQMADEAADAKSRLQSIAEKDENANVRDSAVFALDAMAEAARETEEKTGKQ